MIQLASRSTQDRVDPSALRDIRNAIAPTLAEIMRRPVGEVALLENGQSLPDSVAKLLVRCARGQPAWVIYWSPAASPNLVADCMNKAATIRTGLGSGLGDVILAPVAQGELVDRTYAVVPYCVPTLSHGRGRPTEVLRRFVLGGSVRRWLFDAVSATIASPRKDELETEFVEPLQFLVNAPGVQSELREAAANGLRRLESGAWKPLLTMEHGDLWRGNVLWRPRETASRNGRARHRPAGVGAKGPSWVLIDWYGAQERGRPFYDLVRLADSFRFSRRRTYAEVRRRAELLRCDECDAMPYLLASLGRIGLQPNHFPMARYIKLVQSCYGRLEAALRLGKP